MKNLCFSLFFVLLTLSTVRFYACKPNKSEKKIIVYINSYHQGHPSSDEIMQSFMDNVSKDSFEIYSWYMDTKKNPSKEFIEKKAEELLDSIIDIEPDILVVSDDNAVKYIVEPHLNTLMMPVVFCGVNWTDSEYNLSSNRVTGILEILPVAEALSIIKSYYPSMEKLLVLSENTTTSRKEEQILDTLFQRFDLSADYKLVNDFEHWKSVFTESNTTYDVIYISTHAAIEGWNHTEAVEFINQKIKIPAFTCEDFMMPYAVLGVTKIAGEHGEWAASTAKKILTGRSPSDFPVTRNKKSTLWLNALLSEKIGFIPDSTFMKKAKIITSE